MDTVYKCKRYAYDDCNKHLSVGYLMMNLLLSSGNPINKWDIFYCWLLCTCE